MNEIAVPTLSHTQEEWVVEQFIQKSKSTRELVEIFREIYPTFGSDVRGMIGEIEFEKRLLYRFKDIRKKHADRIVAGRAELKESKVKKQSVEPVPMDPEAYREYQLDRSRHLLAKIHQQLESDDLSPRELQTLIEARDKEEARIQSLSQIQSAESTPSLGSTNKVESWNVHWNPLNPEEELLYFGLTGSYGNCSWRMEIQRRVEKGEQIPTKPGLVDNQKQYKLPLDFDILGCFSDEAKRDYEDFVSQWNEITGRRQLLGGDGNYKACEEPDYDEYASLEKRYSDDWSDPADSGALNPSAEVEPVDGASEANPANFPAPVPSSNGVHATQNGYGVIDYENMSIPRGFTIDMWTNPVKVRGRRETFDILCPEGCVSPDSKRGIGYITYFDKDKLAGKYLWVTFNCYNSDNPMLPHPDFPKPLPSPELPTKSMPEIGHFSEDDPGVFGDDLRNNDLKAREEANRVLGVNAEIAIEKDGDWREFEQAREANREAFRTRSQSYSTWCVV